MHWQERAMVAVFLVSALVGCHESTAPRYTVQLPLVINPGGGGIQKCNAIQLQVRDAAGAWIPLDSTTWISSDSIAAPISTDGVVHALHTTPKFTIQATVRYNEIQGSAQVAFSISETSAASCPLSRDVNH